MNRITQYIDPVGKVYIGKDIVVRKISAGHANQVKAIIHSGLTHKLVEKKLFPQTTLKQVKNVTLLIHRKIKYCSEPEEWSFEMLKDAALMMLEVDKIARSYGYTLKDFHSDNVCFEHARPIFFDFGSITKDENKCLFNTYYPEFLHRFFLPLYLWSKGDEYAAVSFMLDETKERRFFGVKKLKCTAFNVRLIAFITRVLRFVKRRFKINLGQIRNSPARNMRLIKNLKHAPVESPWMNYHDKFYKEVASAEDTNRFKSIIELIKPYTPKTVLDVAGNSGAFSIELVKNIKQLENVYCCDCDHNALERLYKLLKENGNPLSDTITPLFLNIVYPSRTYLEKRYARLKSDVVCALALTHHLILSQYIEIEFFFSELKEYAKKAVIVEFMPLGLYGGGSTPKIPDWYTLDWFTQKFEKFFVLKGTFKLGENRIALLGEVEETN